ncbi:hypothetical protein [Microbispora sp. ATCC PTA-5024]|uniref:hypothetical protein n=1 Tax=Microbispora sp. ATCC PTA-5024 TaxID=316330 RepID=UPI0012ED6306|nr:hypothetical protein [Microbispora sp. ATCC PTA-5024]
MPSVETMDDLVRAIAEFEVEDLDLQAEPAALAAARRSLAESGLLLVGEIHGVRENPLVIRALTRLLEVDAIALEWSEELAGFLRRGLPVDHPLWWFGDGRVTAGHFAVLHADDPLTVTLFDGAVRAGDDWSARDWAMAHRVLGLAARTLVVAGNAHTSLDPTDDGVPMGAVIAEARPGVRAVRIQYGTGRFYNGGPREVNDDVGPAGLRLEGEELVLALPEFHEATVPHLPLERLQQTYGRLGRVAFG